MNKDKFLSSMLGGWHLNDDMYSVYAQNIPIYIEGLTPEQLEKIWVDISGECRRLPSLAEIKDFIAKEKYRVVKFQRKKTNDEKAEDYVRYFMEKNERLIKPHKRELDGYIYSVALGIAGEQINRGKTPYIEFNRYFISECESAKIKLDNLMRRLKKR